MNDLFRLDGQVVLVTGATKGIGRGIVERVVQQGARVALSSRTPTDCAAVAARLNAQYGDDIAIGVPGDLADLASLQSMVDAILTRWGRIDTLVCNAAKLGFHGPSADTPVAEFEAGLQFNVHHNFRLCHMVIPQMRARRSGAIIFISSGAGLMATPEVFAYGAQKAAVNHMARMLAAELAPYNIRVNAVAPGLIRSAASQAIWENPATLHALEQGIPLGRIGEPDEIAAAVIFLAAAGGAYTTGNVLAVDGGKAYLPSTATGATLVEAFIDTGGISSG